MNSVHEPSPNGYSKTIPSRKIRSKTKPGAGAPSWPSWHAQVRTAAPRRAHGRAQAVVSWPGPGRIVTEALAVSWPAWPYRRPPLGRVAVPRAQRPLCAPVSCACAPTPSACAVSQVQCQAVSQVQWLYCNTALPIALAPMSQYTRLYCDTTLPPTAF